jgi:hypothetical protein
MLKRRKFVLLCGILLLAGSVVAEPPCSIDIYESMIRAQTEGTPSVVRTAAVPSPSKGRLAVVQAADADAALTPKTIKLAEPIQNGMPVPPTTTRRQVTSTSPSPTTAALVSPAQPCQSCSPPQYYARHKCVWRHCYSTVEPFGFCMNGAVNGQVMNGLAAQTVFYQYDFNNTPAPGAPNSIDRAGLNFCGRQQLSRVAELVNHLPVPRVVIETSRNPQIDEARRQTVIAGLSEVMGTAVPADWVVIDQPPSNPLSGEEAQITHENLLRQTESRGLYDANDRSSDNGGSGGNSINNINR